MRAVQFPNVLLGIELHAELLYQFLLRFKEIDVTFLIRREFLEKGLGDSVVYRIAVLSRIKVERARFDFRRQITAQNFLDSLADAQGIKHLHIWEPIEEENAIDKAIGVLHLLNGFLAPLFGETLVASIVENAVVEPVLVDCRQFAAQASIEIVEYLGVAAHSFFSRWLTSDSIFAGQGCVLWGAIRAASSPQKRLRALRPYGSLRSSPARKPMPQLRPRERRK